MGMIETNVFVFLELGVQYADLLARLQNIIGVAPELQELETQVALGVLDPVVDPTQLRDAFQGEVLGLVEGCQIETAATGDAVLVAKLGGPLLALWRTLDGIMFVQAPEPLLTLVTAPDISPEELQACNDLLVGLSFRFDRLVFTDDNGQDLDSYELAEEDDDNDD